MIGIKNLKKKLKGFQVRPPNMEKAKKVLLYLPYVIVFYVTGKFTWLYQYCRGSTVIDRLVVLLTNYPLAFKDWRKVWWQVQLQQSAYGESYILRAKMEKSSDRVKNMVLHVGEMKKT